MRADYLLAKSGSEYGQVARPRENGNVHQKSTSGQQRKVQTLHSEYPQWS